MAKLKWLKGYSGQSTDELIALEGKYRTDSIVLAFEEALQQKVMDRPEDFSEEEGVVVIIEGLEREVNNGGYGLFFTNYSVNFAPVVVEALNSIGCVQTAALTQEAIDALGIEGPLTVEAVEQAMDGDNEERDGKLEACTDRYFEVAGDLSGPLFEFIKNNRDKIALTNKGPA